MLVNIVKIVTSVGPHAIGYFAPTAIRGIVANNNPGLAVIKLANCAIAARLVLVEFRKATLDDVWNDDFSDSFYLSAIFGLIEGRLDLPLDIGKYLFAALTTGPAVELVLHAKEYLSSENSNDNSGLAGETGWSTTGKNVEDLPSE